MLPEGLDHLPDILSIGTQESYPERFQWEVSVQETLGPSHVLFHSAALGTLHLAIYMRRDLLWFCSGKHFVYVLYIVYNVIKIFCELRLKSLCTYMVYA